MKLVVGSGKPRLLIAVWEWRAFFGAEAKARGIRANVASFTRLHPNIMMTKAKVGGNYVSSILAKTESQRAGFDEAIMLDPQGFVAECTGENITDVIPSNLGLGHHDIGMQTRERGDIRPDAARLGFSAEKCPPLPNRNQQARFPAIHHQVHSTV